MKKCLILAAMLLLLTGCGTQETFETLADNVVQPASAPLWQMVLDVPQDASVTVLQGENGEKIYLCDGYTVAVQTFSSGDLKKTLQTLTGYEKEDLTLMQTLQDGAKRYECVWTAAGEGENQVGRLCLLDDGNYHYALTLHTAAEAAGELTEQWKNITTTFAVNIGP